MKLSLTCYALSDACDPSFIGRSCTVCCAEYGGSRCGVVWHTLLVLLQLLKDRLCRIYTNCCRLSHTSLP